MIYLDHNATTPVEDEVAEVVYDTMLRHFANPASKHIPGQESARIVEQARREVAALCGTTRRAVLFTGGATESAAMALRGLPVPADRRRLLVAATEHNAVLDAAAATDADVTHLRVRTDGLIDLENLRELLDTDVAAVVVMAANNETGVINDVPAIAALAHGVGALMICDITQALGKMAVDLDGWAVDVAFGSAHKMYGPKGIGFLAVRPALQKTIRPLIAGGGQERGLRGGTVNTAGIAGFGRAATITARRLDDDIVRMRRLTDLLHFELHLRTDLAVYGKHAPRVPNTLCARFRGAPAEDVLACLPGVAISSGSACSSSSSDASHVLVAMGVEPGPALEALRLSVGRHTTEEEVRRAAALVADAVARVRMLNHSRPGHRADRKASA